MRVNRRVRRYCKIGINNLCFWKNLASMLSETSTDAYVTQINADIIHVSVHRLHVLTGLFWRAHAKSTRLLEA